MEIITRECSCLRTLYYQGKCVKGFVFFNDGKILTQVEQGWLEDANDGYFGDTISIYLSSLKRKNKVDLKVKENYYISCGKNYSNETEIMLYIYTPIYSYLGESEKETYTNSGIFYTYDTFIFPILNDRNSYNKDTVNKTVKKESTVNYENICLRVYKGSRKTEECKKQEALIDKVEDVINHRISIDSIEKIVELYKEYKNESI